MHKLLNILRLLWSLALTGMALLIIIPSPNFFFWRVALLASEWSHWIALAGLPTLLPGWRRNRTGQIGGILGLGVTLVALSPLVRALPVARNLPAQLAATFGPANTPLARPAPLSLRELLVGVKVPSIAPQTLVYAEHDGQVLDLDLYPAQGPQPAPLVVVIHGGAWEGGDKNEMPALGRYLAGRGYAVAAINYRLAPQSPFPAARDDLNQALEYLSHNAGGLGIDASRIMLIGRSAGAQLALLVAYTRHDPAIRGVVGFYGPTDLPDLAAHPANPAILNTDTMLYNYVGSPLKDAERYQAASPINNISANTPPTLLIHGQRDEMINFRQSQRLAEQLAQAGRPHLLLALPWANHAADFNLSGPSGQLSLYAVEYFVSSCLL
ncbi:alpha/beta hydrolase [Candidatus Oscillochloris fontis]|uniref:alpha/beta hydrolase n=1 Tax=Candidatus Oscillochloris fontis TaxID=2496868 RepID=UPI0013755D9A|nr:alpha/beta hydrolase [Candidatus Oscillochloris fontis]